MPSLVPIYYQIKNQIKAWIIDGEYAAGDKIPSVNALSRQFNVNGLTIRRAVSQLVQEGILVTKKGSGTFVKSGSDLFRAYNLEFVGFMDDLFYHAQQTVTRKVYKEIISAPRPIRDKLKLGDSCPEVMRIDRLRFRKDIPFAYTVNYLPMEVGNNIRTDDLYQKPMPVSYTHLTLPTN